MLDFYRRWQAPVEDEKVAYQRCNVPGIILGPFEAPINYVQRMKASSPLFFFFFLASFVHRPASLLSLLPLRCSLFFFSLVVQRIYRYFRISLSLSPWNFLIFKSFVHISMIQSSRTRPRVERRDSTTLQATETRSFLSPLGGAPLHRYYLPIPTTTRNRDPTYCA